jgi:Xaa-Pro aminopeptidase
MMKNSKAGMYEYELEAYFDFELKRNGVKDKAFTTITASGKNGTVLHYSENSRKTAENELVLVDCGATYKYYSGDITRTFPVNGKFTDEQRLFYNIVLEGQKKVISAVREGIEYKSLNDILKKHYAVELKKCGLIKEDSEVSKYYYHSVSHQLGLETHDAGRRNCGVLKAGMVITVEPGLYIAEKSIGIRIEDNVLVTKDGCEVLSADIVKEIDDIEKLMKK